MRAKILSIGIAAMGLAFSGAALAVDGVIEINQARAMAGGTTADDEPGFPVTIGETGSYRLTGNLDLTAEEADTNAIDIEATNVILDLNGFSIIGQGTGASGGDGVNGGSDVTVKNGTIKETDFGIRLAGNARVEGVNVIECFLGIRVADNAVVTNNRTQGNELQGIQVQQGALVHGNEVVANSGGVDVVGTGDKAVQITDNVIVGNENQGIQIGFFGNYSGAVNIRANTIASNGGAGIFAGDGDLNTTGNTIDNNGARGILFSRDGGGLVIGNTITNNDAAGIERFDDLAGPVAYKDNYIDGNETTVSGTLVEIGENLCNGDTACP